MTKHEIEVFIRRQEAYREKQAQLYHAGQGNLTLHKSQVMRATKLILLGSMAESFLDAAEHASQMLHAGYEDAEIKAILGNLAALGRAYANLTCKEVYPLE